MQETTFCAVCALLRLNDGEHPGLVLAGLPRDGARHNSDPLCAHHRRALHIEPIEAPMLDARTGLPVQPHYNGTPVMEIVDFKQRHFYEQIDLIDLINGTPRKNDGLTNWLRDRLRKWQIQRYIDEHIDEQVTVQLTPEAIAEAKAEEAANEEMFKRIAGYLALRAAGLDTEPVTIDDDSDRISGEEW